MNMGSPKNASQDSSKAFERKNCCFCKRSQGGYKISKDPKSVNMTKFFEIMEGPMGIMDCYFDSNCEQLHGCNIREPINRINNSIRNMFNKMTLADITF